MKFRIILAFMLIQQILPISYISYAQSDLDPSLEPIESERMSEESWEEFEKEENKDYRMFSVTIDNPKINVSSATQNQPQCSGYATSMPTYKIYWYRRNIREDERLRIFFISLDDTILVLQKPDGSWLCNDDSFGTEHPTIDIERPRSGNYTFWVASKESGSNIEGKIFVTLASYDPRPSRYPTNLTSGVIFVGSGAGSRGAEIIYVDESSNNASLDVSIDLTFNLLDNEEIRVGVWPIDADYNYPQEMDHKLSSEKV